MPEIAHGMGNAAGFALKSDCFGGLGNTISGAVRSVDGVGVARPTYWMETQVAGGSLSPGFQTSLHRAEAHEVALFFVPQGEGQTFYALPYGDTVHLSQLRIAPEAVREAIVRDSAAQMVDMMGADICGEPA